MSAMLLFGRWVVLSVDDIRADYAVLVQGGRVVEVGPIDEMRQKHSGVIEHGGTDCAILPGLINAHHHCYGVELANQNVPDDFLEPWMFYGTSMVGLSPYVSSAHAGLRLIKTGVTAVVDMCSSGPTRADAEDRLLEKAQGYREIGLRTAIAPGERWQNRIVHGHGEEAEFLASLPATLRTQVLDSEARRNRLSPDAYFDLLSHLVPQSDGLIDYWFGPTGPQWTPDDVLARIATQAERLDTRVQTHALESFYEGLESPRIRGKRLMRHFSDLGVLNDRLSLAHVVWPSDADIEDLARSGTQVSHNPGSNLRLRSGVAPVSAMQAAGVHTALGMDGTTLGGAEDIFAEMRLALALNRPPHPAAPALTTRDVLRMATEGGARLMGRAHELGKLLPGFCADAIVVDMTRAINPWTAPNVDPLDLIVGRVTARDVRDVVVNGQIILRDGMACGVDEPALLDRLRDELDASPPDPSALKVAQSLRPHLKNWYARWEREGTQPAPVLRYCGGPNQQENSI